MPYKYHLILFQSEAEEPKKDEQTDKLDRELAVYRTLPRAEKDDCVLSWWKKNQAGLPILSTLAKVVLGIPASASKSERVCSKGRLLVMPKRQCLATDILEEMVIITLNTEFLDTDDC